MQICGSTRCFTSYAGGHGHEVVVSVDGSEGLRVASEQPFENHHQSRIAAYQVNCLVSRDPTFGSWYRIATTHSRFMSWNTCRRALVLDCPAIGHGWARWRFCSWRDSHSCGG